MFSDNGNVLWGPPGPYGINELPLSEKLVADLEEWNRLDEFDVDSNWSEMDLTERGCHLAEQVQRELGSGYIVEFEDH